MKQNKLKKKDSKGITLIALVITIIVLLILAGISISILTGENGILTQASKARDKYKSAEEEEKEALSKLERELLQTGNISVEKVRDEVPGQMDGKGTEEEPYLIESIEDLIQFSQNVNSGNSYEGEYIKLAQNLDFNSDLSYFDPNNIELFDDYNNDGNLRGIKEEVTDKLQRGFIPIGKESAAEDATNRDKYTGNFFSGNFNGDYKTIANIYIKCNEEGNVLLYGLFGGNLGKIQNLNITGNLEVAIPLRDSASMLGGIAAYNEGNIENCYNLVKIQGDNCYPEYVRWYRGV